MIVKRLIAVLVACALPPAAVYLICGRSKSLLASGVLFVAGLAIFFLLAALPGLAVWALAILHAWAVSLTQSPSLA